MMKIALILLTLVGAANASEYFFTYEYAICKDGTVHNCNADEQVYCENLCFDHKGFVEHFNTTLQVPYRNRRSPNTWHEGLIESFNQAHRHYEDVVKPRLEEARKAEEFLKEEARKAEEFLKEKERKDCLAKMIYPVKVWACPFGNYVSEPTSCEKDIFGRSVAEHAVEVDTRRGILPPGESCTGRNWEDLTHADQLKYQLDKANSSCNYWKKGPDCSDEDKATALYLASEKALAKQRLASDIRMKTLPYDCLAGVCLNAPATSIADKLVTVSEVKMHRKVEVCSGRVVAIEVSAGWISPGYGGYVDILSGAEHTTYDGGWPSSQHAGQLKTEMEALGWKVNDGTDEGFSTAVHPNKRGIRSIESGGSGGRWWVTLTTQHADKDALCVPKRQQGL